MKKISLGFSPCPNDCFIFEALIHKKIDNGDFEFDLVIADVEELNKLAFQKKIAVTKLSFHALAHLCNEYSLLNSGSALGFGVGPLLISKKKIPHHRINELKIAIPGKYTTANFLLSLAFPEAKNKIELIFSDIENAVLSGKADAGLIIHENRFTYGQKGLQKIIDLGEWWQKHTDSPIPLGGIAIQRDIEKETAVKIDSLIRKSLEFAFAHPDSSIDFIIENAQEMDKEIIKKHIALYVNGFSLDLGKKGRKAVEILFRKAVEAKLISSYPAEIFIS